MDATEQVFVDAGKAYDAAMDALERAENAAQRALDALNEARPRPALQGVLNMADSKNTLRLTICRPLGDGSRACTDEKGDMALSCVNSHFPLMERVVGIVNAHAEREALLGECREVLGDLMAMRDKCFIPNEGNWWDDKACALLSRISKEQA